MLYMYISVVGINWGLAIQYSLLHADGHTSYMQMDSDLESQILRIHENHPYLAAVFNDSTAQFFIVAERTVLESADDVTSALFELIGAYFAFNMVYPKPLYAVLLFIQHFVLDIKDKQAVPNSVTRILSSLDRIQL